ncbi:MAG: DUF3014 domain-containing protein [Gammaproteobacteria bacterium]|nr:DUF3014 domain-containing protein [Gammaproteobacteria bacterium]
MKKAAPYLILVLLFAVAGWYFFTGEPDVVHELPPPQLPPVTPAETEQVNPQIAEVIEHPLSEPEPEVVPEPLPLLNKSDPGVRQALSEMVGANPLAMYLVKDHVVSRMVVTLDSLSSRQVPAEFNPIKPASDKFVVETEGDRLVLSPENFARYDGYIALIEDVDAGTLMMIYQHYSPLFQEAWEDNGGEGPLDDRLVELIDHLLETPDVPGPIYLTKPEAVYLFDEPVLEAMSAGQKILIRMGSTNAAIVKEKLMELRLEMLP